MRRKRLISFILVLVFAFAMSASAFASTPGLTDGEQGTFTLPDEGPTSQSKTLVLTKELKAYNPDEVTIKAPIIAYTYTVAEVTISADGATVTDKNNVTAPVKSGILPNGGISATAGWTADDTISAAPGGASNTKEISLSFENVVFTGPGIYRYSVTEALADGTYAAAGVTATDGSLTRFIDVYVRQSPNNYTDGSTAAQWDIYGYTCFYVNSDEITEDNKDTSPVKTNGFVSGTTDGSTALSADSYYTYNLTVSKTVTGDAYAEANTAFPFTILFTNSAITKTVDIDCAIEGTVTGWTDPAAAALSAGTTNGITNIKSGSSIKFIGIPCGTSFEVYETNTVTGVTYKVTSTLTPATADPVPDDAVVAGSAPTSAVTQGQKQAYQSTAVTVTPEADKAGENYAVDVVNEFVTISPTGVIVRYAPYALVLIGGIFLLLLGWKFLRRNEEEKA